MKRTGRRPTLSIVTIHLNRLSDLQRTAASVWSQKGTPRSSWEWRVVDGNSTDGSKIWLRKNVQRMSGFVSGKDNGIYDAMNKGTARARGEWVIFLNAGDAFRDSRVLFSVMSKLETSDSDILFGHVQINYENGDSRIHHASKTFLKNSGMPTSHQAMFCRRKYLVRFPFDIREKIAGDFDFLCRAERGGAIFEYLDLIVSDSAAGGISDTNRLRSIQAHWRLASKYSESGKVFLHARYVLVFLYAVCTMLIRQLFPPILFLKFRHLYWRLRGNRS